MSLSFDGKLEALLELYGRSNDPIWNGRVRPQCELALELALKISLELDAQSVAKIFLAHPQVVEVALATLPPEQIEFYAPLLEPSKFGVDSRQFASHERFLTPLVMKHLKPLVVTLASKLNIEPAQLWPEGFSESKTETLQDTALKAAKDRLAAYLLDLEPYSELVDFEVRDENSQGWLLWPIYRGDLLVFGGAQYFMGKDQGMLCVPCVYSSEEVLEFYNQNERCSLTAPSEPGEAPEAWARNCASTARAVASALNGNTESLALGTLGHWEAGQFVDGETASGMLRPLGYTNAPPLSVLSTIPDMLKVLPTGSHLMVGLRWKNSKRGHWFNVRNNGAGAEWIEGQTGASGSWPPPFLKNAEPEGLVLRSRAAKKTWNFM